MSESISKIILTWYSEHKRDLPWRKSHDPYMIWLSEIILQQTRMEQGLPYFDRFARHFPDVDSLASANEDEVLKLWQGLGYYSRARNMHQTAKEIVAKFGGQFPDTYEELIKLKGIGDYTASLILSVCFNKAYAVVDGNVNRIVSRLFAIEAAIDSNEGKKLVKSTASHLLDKNYPGDFNQALMDFGSLVCTFRNPACLSCPLSTLCKAYKQNKVEDFPVKNTKKGLRLRYLNYFLICDEESLLLRKRTSKDIWKNLYELALIENESDCEPDKKMISEAFGFMPSSLTKSMFKKHKLTHQELHISFYKVRAEEQIKTISDKNGFIKVAFDETGKYAVPKPIEVFLKLEINKRLNIR